MRRIRTLLGAAALTLAVGLSLPSAAEASHRHSRYCGHGYAYADHGYAYADHGYAYADYGYYPRYNYSYSYRPRYYSHRYYDPYPVRYYYRPRPPVYVHYHNGYRCTRPHLSIGIGF